jgi:hypothetical protein
MREGIIRVLEGMIDPSLLQDSNLDNGNASSDDEAQSARNQDFT